MTVAQIIEEIRNLPPDEQAQVIRFAYQLDAQSKMTPEELSAAATRLAGADNEGDANTARQEIIRGFYGTEAPLA